MRQNKWLLISLFFVISNLVGQNKFHFEFEMDSLEIKVGESKQIKIKLLNKDGKLAQNPFFISGARKSLSVSPRISDSTGVAIVTVKAHKPGRLRLSTRSITVKRDDRIRDNIIVNVPYPPLDKIVFNKTPNKLYVGTITEFLVEVFDISGLTRENLDVELTSSKKSVADFDAFGNLETKKPGRVTITAKAEGINESFKVSVVKNPTRSVKMNIPKTEIRTGDVLHLNGQALDKRQSVINDAPITYTYSGQADYGEFGLPAAGLVTDDGRFVAETSGLYTLTASSGGYSSQATVKVIPRNVKKKVELVGHGLISDVLTADLWIWPGIGKHKGKDFAVTGTWGSNGEAYFWDVSNPDSMIIIDTITVDARSLA